MEKIALITGASRGIGAAIAKVLASDYRVIVNYKSSEKLAEEEKLKAFKRMSLRKWMLKSYLSTLKRLTGE